jgi:hypothetical protein
MSWLFSQALVEEYSEASSLDGAQSAQSSGSHTQQAYCAPDKMTAFSRLSRFGMTYKPLTATHGEALLMSCLAAFRAKTFPQRGGGGITGARSSMWKHMARIICEVGPQFVFVENSSVLTSRGLGVVLGDLAQMGFDARWCVLGAADVGANHQRDRIWIVAKMANPDKTGLQGSEWLHSDSGKTSKWGESAHGPITECCAAEYGESNWWDIEPSIQRVADGVAARVDRLKAIGNGQVPLCAATAWRLLNEQ